MKLPANTVSVQTNNQAIESHEFGIGDVSTIIEILRNRLYSNPIKTLTQEYLSNARDSHREANKDQTPIRVTLPTKLESCLKVRDFGVGLSKERVKEVFVNYGISTKRVDDSQTGGFGLGAKSAWAYSDSFVVVSYYNGTCSTYVAHTGKNKNGNFELINEVATDEPNGVEVQIPVKESDINLFVDAVYRTTMFWEVKPELKGITEVEIPKSYLGHFKKYEKENVVILKDDDFTRNLFSTHNLNGKVFLLIDKIPYGISRFQWESEDLKNLTSTIQNDHVLFVSVPNGSVEVAASREEISNDKKNIAKISEISRNAIGVIKNIVDEQFDKEFENLNNYVATFDEVKDTFRLSSGLGGKSIFNRTFEYSYEDLKFSVASGSITKIKCNKFNEIRVYSNEEQARRTVVRCERQNDFDIKDPIVVKDIDISDITLKKKLKSIIGDANGNSVYYIDCSPEHISNLKKCCNIILVSELKHETTNKPKKRAEGFVSIRKLTVDRPHRSLKVVSSGRIEMSVSKIEEDGDFVIVPFSSSEKYSYDNHEFMQMVAYLNKNNYEVIKCSKKDYEEIVDLENVFDYDDVTANLSSYIPISEKLIDNLVFSRANNNLLKLKSVVNSINDPDVKKFISLCSSVSGNKTNCSVDILENHYPYYAESKKKYEEVLSLETIIFSRYPLIEGYYYRSEYVNEYVYYINHKYDSLYKGKKILEKLN